MIHHSQVVDECRSLIGTLYLHQGRTEHGVDCIGLPVLALERLGLPKYDPQPRYPRDASGQLQPLIEQFCEPISSQHGALALFKIAGAVRHCGVLTTDNGDRLIHAYQNVGMVKEHILNGFWRNKLVATYAMPGVTYEHNARLSKLC